MPTIKIDEAEAEEEEESGEEEAELGDEEGGEESDAKASEISKVSGKFSSFCIQCDIM